MQLKAVQQREELISTSKYCSRASQDIIKKNFDNSKRRQVQNENLVCRTGIFMLDPFISFVFTFYLKNVSMYVDIAELINLDIYLNNCGSVLSSVVLHLDQHK